MFFLADLGPTLERFGDRDYRVAQLEAAVSGGRLYLAAYAPRLGATGLTFYDDDMTEFSLSAAGKSIIFLVALGRPTRGGRAALELCRPRGARVGEATKLTRATVHAVRPCLRAGASGSRASIYPER